MNWYDAYKHKPKDGKYVWVWDVLLQKQQLFIAKWQNGDWDANQLPENLARIWAYVLDEDKD